MPSYKKVLYYSLHSYPSLFHEEKDVLNHLFFVLGSGYRWKKNGELVYESLYMMKKVLKERQKEFLKEYGTNNIVEIQKIEYAKKERRINLFPEDNNKIYPLCELSNIVCIPENIKTDWLAAAKKALELSKTYIRTPRDDEFLEIARKKIEKIDLLKKK